MISFRNYLYIQKKTKCMRGSKVLYRGRGYWYLGSFHILGKWRHMLMKLNEYDPELKLVEDVMLFSLPEKEEPRKGQARLWEE